MSSLLNFQHLKLYLRLKQQECLIEKSIEAFLVNSKVDVEVWHNIKRDIDKTEEERRKIANTLKEKVTTIYEELKAVKSLVNEENLANIDLENFKTKLQSLWKLIQEFKSSCNNPDSLIKEQKTLDAELSALIRVIRKHKNFSCIDSPQCKTWNCKTQSQKEISKTEYNYDDVEDFCTLLAKTGHTGTWSEEDHLLYVKLRKKHKSIPALVVAIQAKCPDLSKECIINHEAWYKTYLELRKKQKIAVQEWRKRKETERRAKVTDVLEPGTCPDGAAGVGEDEATADPDHLLKVAEHKKAEIERKKEMVRKWKEQREKLRLAEEERLKSRLRARREQKENQRQVRAAKLKQQLAEHKEKQTLERQQLPDDQDNKQDDTSFMSALILQIYRARDQQLVEKRKNILQSKMNEQKKHVPPIQYDFSKINESTLLKETKAWQDKHKRIEPKTTQSISYIKDLPRRAMVSWKSYEVPGSLLHRQR